MQHSKHGLDHSERFFIAVTLIAVCSTGILLALYLFRIVYVFNTIPWLKIEFYYCLAATLLFALSTLLLTSALPSKGFHLLIGTVSVRDFSLDRIFRKNEIFLGSICYFLEA